MTAANEQSPTDAAPARCDVLVIGGGSHLVVAGEGFDGTGVRVTPAPVAVGGDDGRPLLDADAGGEADGPGAAPGANGFGGLGGPSGVPASTGPPPGAKGWS